MNKIMLSLLILTFLINACTKEEPPIDPEPDPTEEKLYFPPKVGNTWESIDMSSLAWNESAVPALENYLELNGTRAFILLKNGKIVMEKYWNSNITNTGSFNASSLWYWASAGKTLTAAIVGKAQEESLLSIEDKTSTYLGTGWTSMASSLEDQIKIKHQLMMTTGLDYNVAALDCTADTCLYYLNDPETEWFYHNAPYTLLEQVVSQASGMSYNEYTETKIGSQIGMSGTWIAQDDLRVFWSTARDAARFALLLLADGTWNETPILSDMEYLNQMRNSSQSLNPSYGYLTWLNGQSGIVYPGLSNQIATPLSSHAPSDLYAGMGKNGQFIEVVPSQNLVVIRMGEAPDNSLVPLVFHNEMWAKINEVIQ